jgi:hypothetical protein
VARRASRLRRVTHLFSSGPENRRASLARTPFSVFDEGAPVRLVRLYLPIIVLTAVLVLALVGCGKGGGGY